MELDVILGIPLVWGTAVAKATRELEIAERAIEAETLALKRKRRWVAVVEEAQQLAQEVGQRVQKAAYNRIAGVVSKCLELVFDEPYILQMDFEQKRGRTEVNLSFARNGLQVDPLTASGGGVVDVASFALRLASLVLSRPPLRRLLVLDEPFKFVSEEYRARVRQMLETLSSELQVQILMVTHIKELQTGKVVELC